jgi:hypothetical protein
MVFRAFVSLFFGDNVIGGVSLMLQHDLHCLLFSAEYSLPLLDVDSGRKNSECSYLRLFPC